MNFDERNSQWTGNAREFRQLQSRATRVWMIQVDGNVITTSWGQLNGALQIAHESMPGVNIGKSNEKSPEQYAVERAREACRKKHWEGYREFENGTPVDEASSTTIDFDNLPLNLCFYKPDNSMGSAITKKAEKGEVWYSRKRNGLAFILARGSAHPRLYTRKMLRQHDDEAGTSLTWNDRFPHIIDAASKVMPGNSILLGELIVNRNGDDDFRAIQSYTKSLTSQSLNDQVANEGASFYIWDIAFWGGIEFVKSKQVRERYDLIQSLYANGLLGPALLPVEYYPGHHFESPNGAITYLKNKKWEGFVVVDPNGRYGEKAFNFKGKPDRPREFCAKLKPNFEDDFVAYWDPEKGWGERSTKMRNNLGIKSVALYQYNSQGQMVYISNVSSGLTDDQKKNWASTAIWPRVWKVEYKDRRYTSDGDETNALDFASFVEERKDKAPEECINEKL